MMVAPLLVAATLSTPAVVQKPVRYASFVYQKALIHEVRIDTDPARTSTGVALKPAPRSIRNFAQAAPAPAVVVTGTFFHPTSGYPVGDVLVEGRLKAEGNRGSALAVTWDGKVKLFDTGFGEEMDWSPYRYALRGLVRVIRNGEVCPDPRSQRFRDPRIWGRAERVAAGLTKDGTLKLFCVTKPVYLSELGKALRSRGIVEAVSLDGGSSAGMIYRGKTLMSPRRPISNVVSVVELGEEPELPESLEPRTW